MNQSRLQPTKRSKRPGCRKGAWENAKARIGTFILFCCSIFLLTSCQEFISPDISAEAVRIIAPADSLFTNRAELSFWWQENADIERYEFQMVTPDFSAPLVLVDTFISVDRLDYFLTEDVYSWRIRGVNEGSSTEFTTRFLVIDETAPLLPVNLSPDTLSGSAATLSWDSRDPVVGSSNQQFGVQDSLIIFQRGDSSATLIEAFTDTDFQYTFNPQTALQGPGNYFFQVISRDLVGNRRESNLFTFWLNP